MLQRIARPESSEHLPSLAEAEAALTALADVYSSVDAAFQPFASALKNPASLALDQSADMVARYQTLIEQIPAVVFMAFLDKGMGEAYVSPQIEIGRASCRER